MGSTINKNEHILHKSQSEVLSRNLDQSKSLIRTSTIIQRQKQLEVVSSLKKLLQQSIKGDDCDDSPLQQLNTNQQKQNPQEIRSQEMHPQEMLTYDLNRDLLFEARALNSKIKASMTNSTTIPAMISLKAKDLLVQQDQRTSLDLVCIIDRSGSMHGEKIKMVQDTLLTLLNFLSEKDRFSVILFDSSAYILFELEKVTIQSKPSLIEKIQSIIANGGTNISNGLIKGIEQLKNRNSINQVTSIFLLSDGQDDITESKLDQLFSGVNFPFTLHTFGYGNDHDAKIMTKISQIGNGNFYFIKNLSLLDEFFVDALGSLITVVGQIIKIDINCNPQPPFDKTIISKTFGSMWQEKLNQKVYQINFPVIASGQRKDFVFELEIPKFENNIENKEQIVTIVNFTLQLQCPKSKLNIEKTCQLNLFFCGDDEQLLNLEKDLDVAVQYYRVKGTDVIEIARLACDSQKFQEAKILIKKIILEIESDQQIKNQSSKILEDLRQALRGCDREQYQNYGQTMMMQQVLNNYQQSGLSAQFNQRGHQLSSELSDQNYFTRHLISTVSNSKSTKSSPCFKKK